MKRTCRRRLLMFSKILDGHWPTSGGWSLSTMMARVTLIVTIDTNDRDVDCWQVIFPRKAFFKACGSCGWKWHLWRMSCGVLEIDVRSDRSYGFRCLRSRWWKVVWAYEYLCFSSVCLILRSYFMWNEIAK